MNSLLVFIRQEIEFLKELNEGLYTEGDNSYYEGQDNAYNHILAFIDSLPEDDPLNDPRFGDGFDAGRAVQRIFDETEETCKESLQVQETCKENTDSFTDEPKKLEEAANEWILSHNDGDVLYVKNAFKDGAKWMANQMLEREDRNDDKLPRYYGD